MDGTMKSFTPAERKTLGALRTRYAEDHDRFTREERARLVFLRWLRALGKLES